MDKETTFKMIMVGLLVQEQERRKAVDRARKERIRNDPVLFAKFKEQKKQSNARRLERVMADPERLAIKRATGKRNAASRRARLNNNPAAKEAESKKWSDWGRERYAYRKANEPGFADKHRARILAYNKTEKGKAIQNATQKRLRAENTSFRLAHMCRTRIADALRGKTKWADLYELVGCSMEELKIHLEKQFVDGMTWNNWGRGIGKWTIDHIKPCASFDLSSLEQQKAAFHYSNTRPMWFVENCSKSSIVDGKFHRYS